MPATKAEKIHMGKVADLGCIICGNNQVVIHHITTLRKGYGSKSSNYQVLPLCVRHHDAKIKGESIHEGVKEWEKKYGTQIELLEQVYKRLGVTEKDFEKVKTFRKFRKVSKPTDWKNQTVQNSNCGESAIIKSSFYKKVMELKRKIRKEAYQKKKLYLKSKKV